MSLILGWKNARLEYGLRVIGSKNINIGNNFYAGKNLWIASILSNSSTGSLCIGNNVSVNDNVHITACKQVTIGNNVLMGSNILITDHDHGSYLNDSLDYLMTPTDRPLHVKGDVVIGDCVWIGDGAKILSGVSIGSNSVIAANSIVTKDVPACTIVSGIPARVIKKLSKEFEC